MSYLSSTAVDDLVAISTRPYRKGATIMTIGRPTEDWAHVLGDTTATGAILDRFLYHAEVIKLRGRGYRMHNRLDCVPLIPRLSQRVQAVELFLLW